MRFRRWWLLSCLLLACPARAVVLGPGDGTGNTGAPPDDPGFAQVGAQAGSTAVHVGGGWVLTAGHVGGGDPEFDGASYGVVAGSNVQLLTPQGGPADLRMFRVHPHPPEPGFVLASGTPPPNADLVLVGRGRDRGPATVWEGHPGFETLATRTLRWGTNRVASRNLTVLGTRAFSTDFTQSGGTAHESQATTGDSGGAVFRPVGGGWELAGLLYAVGLFQGQPGNLVLYGNLSYAAEIATYAPQILALRELGVCEDGLDNDADGLADLDDPGCRDATDPSEEADCEDGLDNDGDGLVDAGEDFGCSTPADASEELDCEDGLDNDGDGLFDFPADPGCATAAHPDEAPACDDGQDNDGDLLIDLDDPECTEPWITSESGACGLGFELALVVPALAALRRRRAAAARRRRGHLG